MNNEIMLNVLRAAIKSGALDGDKFKRLLVDGSILKSRGIGWKTYGKLCKEFGVAPVGRREFNQS